MKVKAAPKGTKSMRKASKVQAVKASPAPSAYVLFGKTVREEITKEYKEQNEGKSSLPEIGKLIAARWQELPAAERRAFEEQAAQAKDAHKEELRRREEEKDPVAALRKRF